MRAVIVSLACLALATAAPALAAPAVIAGAAPERAEAAIPSDCVVEPTGAASARIRCSLRPTAQGPGTELTFLVSAQSTSAQPRCLGAEVVRLSGSPTGAERARSLIVEGTPTPPCA